MKMEGIAYFSNSKIVNEALMCTPSTTASQLASNLIEKATLFFFSKKPKILSPRDSLRLGLAAVRGVHWCWRFTNAGRVICRLQRIARDLGDMYVRILHPNEQSGLRN
jgi:hypothetical protein